MFLYADINWVSPNFRGGFAEISIEVLMEFFRDRTLPRYGYVSLVLEPGFGPRTYGLWAHHTSAALLLVLEH